MRLTPVADNTLYQTTDGSLSNGSGERLFAGVTASGFLRRGLIRFDLSDIPEWATITSVSLRLQVSKTPLLPPPMKLSLHRVISAWGEGSSDAQGEEGAGAPSAPGDATWLHSSYPNDLWLNTGGDFAAMPSAKVAPDTGLVPVVWSSAAMVRDLQGWHDSPTENHGWLIKDSQESALASAKRFNSREFAGSKDHLPLLTVRYRGGVAACSASGECASNPSPVTISTCRCAAGTSIVRMSGGPPGEPVTLLAGQGTAVVGGPGASLCLGGATIWRYTLDAGAIDPQGAYAVDVFNALSGGGSGDLPRGAGSLCGPPGQTYGFQFWYRQAGVTAYSQAVRVTFR